MNKRELIKRYRAASDRISEIAAACEKEKRSRTPEEEVEYQGLLREIEYVRMQIATIDAPAPESRNTLANADAIMRRARDERFDVRVVVARDIMTADGLDDTGVIPVREQDFIKPIEEGLIYDKVGLPFTTGNAGTLRWPTHGKATATWEDETSELVDSNVDFGKLEMTGKRLGIAIPVSRTELEDSEGRVEAIVTSEMPMACRRQINKGLLTLEADFVNGQGKVAEKPFHGPFAQSAVRTADNCPIVELGASVTRKGLLDVKTAVAKTGVDMAHACYAMSEVTKAALEDTKVDAGSGRFVCEGDRVLGYPVFTSSEVPDGVVLFGDWSYQAAGAFGQTSMIIDPYTLARRHSTDFVLNMRVGTARLRKEAFAIGMTADALKAHKAALDAIKPTE